MDLWWLNIIGAIVICGGLIFSGVLLWREKSSAGAVGFAFAVVVAGVAVANLPRILKAGYSAKNGETTVGFDMGAVQEAKAQVTSDKNDVEAIKTEVESLANEVKEAQSKIAKSEASVGDMQNAVQADVNEIRGLKQDTARLLKNVEDAHTVIAQTEGNLIQMRDATKNAMRSVVELFYLDLGTRGMFGLPQEVVDQMNTRFVPLQPFAYDNQTEQKAAFQVMDTILQKYRPHLPPTPTQTTQPPSPTPKP